MATTATNFIRPEFYVVAPNQDVLTLQGVINKHHQKTAAGLYGSAKEAQFWEGLVRALYGATATGDQVKSCLSVFTGVFQFYFLMEKTEKFCVALQESISAIEAYFQTGKLNWKEVNEIGKQ